MEKVLGDTVNPAEVKEVKPEEVAANSKSREAIEDMLKESSVALEAEDKPKEEEEEVTEEVETEETENEEDETEDEDSDEESEGEVPFAKKIVDEHAKKDGKQKRIDKLTAVNSELKAEIEAIKAQLNSVPKPEAKKETEYSDEQLKVALQKAVSEGDADLQWEIMVEMRKNAEKSAITKLQQKEIQAKAEQERIANEIAQARTQYAYLSDDGIPEIYDGSRGELDVHNPNSLLNQTAEYLYMHKDYAHRYQNVGGIMVCVNDALKIILNNKKGLKPKDAEKESLKNKVKKSGRKTTVKSNSVKGDSKPKVKTEKDSFEEEIERRKKLSQGIRV